MHAHPYLRAYMAGITVPTLFLLVAITVFTLVRYTLHVPTPIERVIVFPMAVVPNVWGAWNMLYLWLRSRRSLSVGIHGALLPFLLAPAGFLLAEALGVTFLTPLRAATGFPVALTIYYLAWKHLVGFLNKLVGVA
jgi:hypothetical protein